jgi:hypothetical protein
MLSVSNQTVGLKIDVHAAIAIDSALADHSSLITHHEI